MTGRKMGNEDNNAPLGKNIHERLSLAECELLCTLARGVPVGQAIVSLSGGEDEVATWLARGANEVTDGKVHSLNMRDVDCEEKSRRCKEKIGLWWYNASCEYEDVRKAFLCWQRHLSPEGWVILRGHDQPGVARVIKEFTGSYGNFVLVDSVGTVAVLAVDRCVHYWVIDCNEFGICRYCGRKRNFKRMNEPSQMETKKRVNHHKSKLVCVCEDELELLLEEGDTMGKREKAGDRKDKHTERKICKKTADYLEKDAKKK